MAGEPFFGNLFKSKTITDADLDGAVDAFMADSTTGRFEIANNLFVDLAAAVTASPYAKDMLANPKVGENSKRSAVRTAIMLARPVKA